MSHLSFIGPLNKMWSEGPGKLHRTLENIMTINNKALARSPSWSNGVIMYYVFITDLFVYVVYECYKEVWSLFKT